MTAVSPLVRVGALATAVALAGAGCGSSAPVQTEFPYTAPDGRFSVVFPSEPSTGVRQAGEGGLKRNVTATMASKGGDSFGVVFSDYPTSFLSAGPLVVLEAARDASIRNVGGTLVSSEETDIDGKPGLKVKATVASGATKGTYHVRYYLVGTRIYELLVIRNDPKAAEDAVLDFFDSFELRS